MVHIGGSRDALRKVHGALWRAWGCIKEGSGCIMEFRNALKSVQGALWRVCGCIKEGSGCIVEGLGVH